MVESNMSGMFFGDWLVTFFAQLSPQVLLNTKRVLQRGGKQPIQKQTVV